MKKTVGKADIIKHVKVIDIADEFGIDLEDASSGNFDLRCICPSKNHKNGSETSGSLYIDSENNNFYCFGCSMGSNCIDFYMMCADVGFIDAFNLLRKRVDPELASEDGISGRRENNLLILLEISSMIKAAIYKNPRDLKWINALMKQTDSYLKDIKATDMSSAIKLREKIKSVLQERYK